jgi:dTDP-4-amino-4,6-dideoxygalactose transaminase
MRPIVQMARPRGIAVIEDAAQAFGAEYEGMKAGGLGTFGCFSFFPTKNLGGFGDGGMVTTGDDALARRVRMLRVHGAEEKHRHTAIGGNFRLDALQAALLRVGLRRVDGDIAQRRSLARLYDDSLRRSGETLVPPCARAHATYNQYVLRARSGLAERFRQHLKSRGIQSERYYPAPMSAQPCLERSIAPAAEAEALAGEHVALPIAGRLNAIEISVISTAIEDFISHSIRGG